MPEHLNDGDRVAVVGGGPAGSFFAIEILKEAKRLGRRLEVIVIERKKPFDDGKDPWLRKGCNRCAGGISPRMDEILKASGIEIPKDLVEEEFAYIWIQSLWKNVPLKVPKDSRMYSIFRGSLPAGRERGGGGFDGFLLAKAAEEGARLVTGEVVGISLDSSEKPILSVIGAGGKTKTLSADFVAVSCRLLSALVWRRAP